MEKEMIGAIIILENNTGRQESRKKRLIIAGMLHGDASLDYFFAR